MHFLSSNRTFFTGIIVGAAFLFIGDYFWHAHERWGCEESYRYVNQDVACGDTDFVLTKEEYRPLKNEILRYIAAQEAEGVVSEVALYFRDLRAGPVFGINEGVEFAPASLLKLPLAFLYLKNEEKDPGFIARQPQLQYTLSEEGRMPFEGRELPRATNFEQTFPPPEAIVEGGIYSVEELLIRMLAYSDNAALLLLLKHAHATMGGEFVIDELYRDLGLSDPKTLEEEVITVRNYASLFRMLYNGTYLNPALSEQLLSWLSMSSFSSGLEAGVPSFITVAHKFGERSVSSTGSKQLHDCGIVYYPENPYLLCIMTKGYDTSALAGVIADISRMVYLEVDSRRIDP